MAEDDRDRFDSRDAAMAWYNSPAYQEVLPLRLAATEGFGMLVDGFVHLWVVDPLSRQSADKLDAR